MGDEYGAGSFPVWSNWHSLIHAADFRAFFDTIPEDRWGTGHYFNEATGQCCAQGFLGPRSIASNVWENLSPKAKKFRLLSERVRKSISLINDGLDDDYKQPTPKQRIIAFCDYLISQGH